MIQYKYSDLFKEDGTKLDLVITDGVLSIVGGDFVIRNSTYIFTNDDLMESLTLHEILCDADSLEFGTCNSSYIEFAIAGDVAGLIGKRCRVYIYLNEDRSTVFGIGSYIIESDKPAADRSRRKVVAYDDIKKIASTDVSEWYEGLFTVHDTITVKEMRESLLRYFSIIDETNSEEMPNDNVIVYKTLSAQSGLSGADVLQALCSINGSFGKINRLGNFVSIRLKSNISALYPSPTLYPDPELFPKAVEYYRYSLDEQIPPIEYEDYIVAPITGVTIRQDDEDVGASFGTEENVYICEGNFLVFGKDADELEQIAERLYSAVNGIYYRPIKDAEFLGNPCLETGDAVCAATESVLIETYILERKLLLGGWARDEISANGEPYRSEKVNDMGRQISQLKGKTAKIEKTVSGIETSVEDLEEGTRTSIKQVSDEIKVEVERAKKGEEDATQAAVSISDLAIKAEIKRASDAEDSLSTRITATAEEIAAEIKRSSEADGLLSTRITANADGLSAEVKRASEAESAITQKANSIELSVSGKVSGDQLVSTLNSKLKLTNEKIEFTTGHIVIDSKNFKLDDQGNATFSGVVTTENTVNDSKTTIEAGYIHQEGINSIRSSDLKAGTLQLKLSHLGVNYEVRLLPEQGLSITNGSGDILCSLPTSGNGYVGGNVIVDGSNFSTLFDTRFSAKTGSFVTSSGLSSYLSDYTRISTFNTFVQNTNTNIGLLQEQVILNINSISSLSARVSALEGK